MTNSSCWIKWSPCSLQPRTWWDKEIGQHFFCNEIFSWTLSAMISHHSWLWHIIVTSSSTCWWVCLLASWCMCLDLWLFTNSHIPTNLCLYVDLCMLTHFTLEFETITLFASKFLVLFLVQSYVMECNNTHCNLFCSNGIVAKFYWHDNLIFTNKIYQS